MWLKLFFLIVTLVNVKAEDNFVDANGQQVLQISSPNEGTRYFKIQRGADGEMTGLVEIPQGGQEQEVVKPLPTNTETMLIRIPEERPQTAPLAPSVLVQNNNDKKDDVVLVEIEKQSPPQIQPNENIIIEEAEPVKLPAPSPPKDVFVINERPVQSERVPTPVIISRLSEPAPRPIPQPTIIVPAPKPQPAPNQVVVIPARQTEPAPNQVVVIPARQPEPAPNQVVVIPDRQPEPASNQVVVIPARQPEPAPNQVVVIPARKPEPAPNQVVVIPARQPDFAAGAQVIQRSPLLTSECPTLYGLYALPDKECSNYIACQEGMATLMTCPKGLVFNPTVQACDWLENVPSCRPQVFSGVTCPSFQEGDVDFISNYRYGQSCTEYIACHRGAPRLLKCDAGLAFDDQLLRCVAADRVQSCSFTLI